MKEKEIVGARDTYIGKVYYILLVEEYEGKRQLEISRHKRRYYIKRILNLEYNNWVGCNLLWIKITGGVL